MRNEIISKRSGFNSTGIPFELNCDSQQIVSRVKGSDLELRNECNHMLFNLQESDLKLKSKCNHVLFIS